MLAELGCTYMARTFVYQHVIKHMYHKGIVDCSIDINVHIIQISIDIDSVMLASLANYSISFHHQANYDRVTFSAILLYPAIPSILMFY